MCCNVMSGFIWLGKVMIFNSSIEEDIMKNYKYNEKIAIDVESDNFSSSEISKLSECLKEIEQHSSTRKIIWKYYKTVSNETVEIFIQYGSLTVDELKKLAQCIRDIEQNKPTRHLKIWMNLPDKTIEETKEINDSVTPPYPIKRVIELKPKTKD